MITQKTSTHSQRIEKIIEKTGMRSQKQLADVLRVNVQVFRDIARGKSSITPELASRIEEEFGVLFKWSMTGEGPMFSEDEGMMFSLKPAEPEEAEVVPSVSEDSEDFEEGISMVQKIFRGANRTLKRLLLKDIQEMYRVMHYMEPPKKKK